MPDCFRDLFFDSEASTLANMNLIWDCFTPPNSKDLDGAPNFESGMLGNPALTSLSIECFNADDTYDGLELFNAVHDVLDRCT